MKRIPLSPWRSILQYRTIDQSKGTRKVENYLPIHLGCWLLLCRFVYFFSKKYFPSLALSWTFLRFRFGFWLNAEVTQTLEPQGSWKETVDRFNVFFSVRVIRGFQGQGELVLVQKCLQTMECVTFLDEGFKVSGWNVKGLLMESRRKLR
jgi:hypothetical protein